MLTAAVLCFTLHLLEKVGEGSAAHAPEKNESLRFDI